MLYATIIVTFVTVLLGLKRDMMMLQQNSNRNDRYINWIKSAGDSTRISRLVFMALFFIFLLRFVPNVMPLALLILAGVVTSWRLITAKYKKPLVFTKRAQRIYSLAVALILLAVAVVSLIIGGDFEEWLFSATVTLCAVYPVSYWFILASNYLLKPVEKRINKKYYDDAARILASNPQLKVIGITGSYGKTSTKHYLHRILSEQYEVMMTPGNFNTTLGVIRTIREYLKPYDQIFIVEMGAKQPNDIKEICDLVHPSIGIITAVGPQHLESFKTIECVQATKFELVDSLPADGLAVVNDDFEYIANRDVKNVECVRYSTEIEDASHYYATDIKYTPKGTYFTIVSPNQKSEEYYTHLLGKCNVSNLIAAVIVATRLGMNPEKIKYAVGKIEQVEHRLSVKRTAAGITIIDDAYNSNPVGSGMALDVLSGMTGQRIIITPGMIELGADQYKLNKEFGKKIGESADLAIIVGNYNKEPIAEGIASTDMPDSQVYYAATFMEAQQLMLTKAKAGDTVLYENDLPDTFK